MLSAGELDALDAVSRIELGFPHDFEGRSLTYGDTYDLIDPPAPALLRENGMAEQASAPRPDPTASEQGRPRLSNRHGEPTPTAV
jgi:hypothetical protein